MVIKSKMIPIYIKKKHIFSIFEEFPDLSRHELSTDFLSVNQSCWACWGSKLFQLLFKLKRIYHIYISRNIIVIMSHSIYILYLKHTYTHLPLDSISRMHMSTTMGRAVL